MLEDSYRLTCACGRTLEGARQPGPQTLTCPQCRAALFVLPRSPWSDGANRVGERGTPFRRYWLLPILAMVLTLAGLAVIFFTFVAPGAAKKDNSDPGAKSASQRADAARELLSQGNFRQAWSELQPIANDVADDDMRQLCRETALFADLMSEPLEQVLELARGLDAAEWQLQFRERYQGKAVIFDDHFVREGGSIASDYALFVRGQAAHLDWSGLRLLSELPLSGETRVILGARLGSVRLQSHPPDLIWTIEFEQQSGVLITQAEGAGLVCPELADAAARELILSQREWLRNGRRGSKKKGQ